LPTAYVLFGGIRGERKMTISDLQGHETGRRVEQKRFRHQRTSNCKKKKVCTDLGKLLSWGRGPIKQTCVVFRIRKKKKKLNGLHTGENKKKEGDSDKGGGSWNLS